MRTHPSTLLWLCLMSGLVFCCPAFAQTNPAHAPRERALPLASWTPQPLLQAAGRPGQRGAISFKVSGFAAETLHLFSPESPSQGVAQLARETAWSVAPNVASQGGIHWLMAESQSPSLVVRASTAWSFPGKGVSPDKLLQSSASGLDLRPLRVPQLGAYREGSRWVYRLRWDGVPMAGQEVLLETENGSSQRFRSDADGLVSIVFPHDYAQADIDPALGAARTRKAYLLSVSIERDGVRHLTTFSNFYTPDLLRERSLGWGGGFAALGMILALPLLLKGKEKKHG